jgi:hypothetical protein
MRRRTALVPLALAASLVPGRVLAQQTATWSGTVTYVNPSRVGVDANRQHRDFIVDKEFDNIRSSDGKAVGREKLVVGAYVRVVYARSPLFGSSRATEIDILPWNTGTPLPIPQQ